MTSWVELTDAQLQAGKPLTQAKARALRDNAIAITEGASGAPSIQAAAIASQAIIETKMAPNAVNYNALKLTYGDVGHAGAVAAYYASPGGFIGFQVGGYHTAGRTATWNVSGSTASGAPQYLLQINDPDALGGQTNVRQYYIQASPPYDLGDGEIPLFIFVEFNSLGKIIATYVAPEAPWHNNGPTAIKADRYDKVSGRGYRRVKKIIAEFGSLDLARASGLTPELISRRLADDPWEEIEVTQAIKNADMTIIPHPFLSAAPGNVVTLLDPVSDLCHQLFELHKAGDINSSVSALLAHGYITLNNAALRRAVPPGVQAVAARWKLTA